MSRNLPQSGHSLHAPPRVVHRRGSRDAYALEAPTWGPPKADGAVRTWAQWLFLNSDVRDGPVGFFCRQARGDKNLPSDPTTVVRYLVAQLAPRDVLDAALEAVEEYRAWHTEGLERALAEVAAVNATRAAAIRSSMATSLSALERLYAEDAAVLADLEPAEDAA